MNRFVVVEFVDINDVDCVVYGVEDQVGDGDPMMLSCLEDAEFLVDLFNCLPEDLLVEYWG
jgi:hypothetical protein